jgi:hypothetical protein
LPPTTAESAGLEAVLRRTAGAALIVSCVAVLAIIPVMLAADRQSSESRRALAVAAAVPVIVELAGFLEGVTLFVAGVVVLLIGGTVTRRAAG